MHVIKRPAHHNWNRECIMYVVCQNNWNSLFLNRKKWRFDKDLRLVVAYRCLGRAVKAMELNWQILLIITLKVKTFTQRHWSCKCFVRVFIQQNPCETTKYLFMRQCLKDKFHVHCILRGESREKIKKKWNYARYRVYSVK